MARLRRQPGGRNRPLFRSALLLQLSLLSGRQVAAWLRLPVPARHTIAIPEQASTAWRYGFGCDAPRRRRRAPRATSERLGETSRVEVVVTGPSEEELEVLRELEVETVYSEVGMRRVLDSLDSAAVSAASRRREEQRQQIQLEAERAALRQRANDRAVEESAAAAANAAGSGPGAAAAAAPWSAPCPLKPVADGLLGRGRKEGTTTGSGAAGTGSDYDGFGGSAAAGYAADAAAATDGDAAGAGRPTADGNGDNGSGSGDERPKRRRLPLPLFDVASVGLLGRWEEMGGNLLVRPPDDVAPVAVIHFLGGAFVGAAPHLSYNYLLTGLADAGFIVVATPYPLGFDYLAVCDGILEKFERAAVPLAREYGALPVVGVGHSCGALLQLLITCLFPDTPRAANALLSFNNKPVDQAVPLFDEVVLPLVTQLLSEGSSMAALGETLQTLRESVLNLADTAARSELAPAIVEGEVLPLVRQFLQVLDQIPPLLKAVASGTREFTPTPEETKEVARRMYRARRTLLVQFENDSIDETQGIKDVIQEGKTLLRMRRPMVDMDLRYEFITGNHVTPLTQDVFPPPTPLDALDPLLGVRQSVRGDFLKTVDQLGRLMVEWLNDAVKPTSYMPR